MTKKTTNPTISIFDQLVDKEQTHLSATFGERHKALGECGELMKETIYFLRKQSWRTHEQIWNAALFLNTVSYDLSIRVIEMAHERDIWKRGLIARSLALILFEIGEDIPSVFGKKFREASTALGVSEDQLNAVGAETKKVSAFWNENRILLKEIRAIAAAHMDHDAIVLHELIDGIDLFDLLRLGILLGSMMNALGAATQPIINFTSELKPTELYNMSLKDDGV